MAAAATIRPGTEPEDEQRVLGRGCGIDIMGREEEEDESISMPEVEEVKNLEQQVGERSLVLNSQKIRQTDRETREHRKQRVPLQIVHSIVVVVGRSGVCPSLCAGLDFLWSSICQCYALLRCKANDGGGGGQNGTGQRGLLCCV